MTTAAPSRLLVAQGGGPTAVINQSLAGVVLQARRLAPDAAVYGARLTGAGFGGACVALAQPDALQGVASSVLRSYAQEGHDGRLLVPASFTPSHQKV